MPVGVPSTVYLEVWGGEETAVRPQNRPNSSGTPVSVRMRLEIFVRVSQSWHCEPLGPDDCHIGGDGDKGGWVSTEVRMSKYICTCIQR